jgi:hypothetical protein
MKSDKTFDEIRFERKKKNQDESRGEGAVITNSAHHLQHGSFRSGALLWQCLSWAECIHTAK